MIKDSKKVLRQKALKYNLSVPYRKNRLRDKKIVHFVPKGQGFANSFGDQGLLGLAPRARF